MTLGRRLPLWQPGRLVLPGVLALAIGLAWIPTADQVRQPDGATTADATGDARAWVLANLPSRPKLVVDDAVWSSLIDAGYPVEQLAAASGVGPDRAAWPRGWQDAAYTVGRDQILTDAADPVGMAQRHSTPVAQFGGGPDMVTVRRVVTDPDAVATARQETAGRVEAGTALAANPRLGLPPKAATLLRNGQVDARALSVLAAVTGEHSAAGRRLPGRAGRGRGYPAPVDRRQRCRQPGRRVRLDHRDPARPVATRPAAAVPAGRHRTRPVRRPVRADRALRRARQHRPAAALSGSQTLSTTPHDS